MSGDILDAVKDPNRIEEVIGKYVGTMDEETKSVSVYCLILLIFANPNYWGFSVLIIFFYWATNLF